MAPKTPSPNKLIFDPARLQNMAEPFLVRVERMEGSAAQVVPLPIKEGHDAPGPGWSMSDVLKLENGILETFGGGTYRFNVTDAAGDSMTWTQVFPVHLYPKRALAPDQVTTPMGSTNPMGQVVSFPVQSFQAPSNMMMQQPPSMPISWPAGGPMPQQGPWPQQPAWPMQAPFPYYSPVPSAYQPQVRPLDETTRLRQEAELARASAQEERHKAEMQRMTDQLTRMQEEMRRNQDKPTGPDPMLSARLEQERALREKAERDAAEARHAAELKTLEARMEAFSKTGPSDTERRLDQVEQERRRDEERRRSEDQLREIREENRRREELMLRQLEELKNRGPDPMMTFLLNQMQSSAESQREIARLQTEAQKEQARLQADLQRERTREQESLINQFRTFMMPPADVARMVNDATSGQHQFVRSMATTFNDVAGVMRDWFSNMSQMMNGPGESPVFRLIEAGIEKAKEFGEKYNQSKAQVEVARAQAQREAAKAQSAAFAAAQGHGAGHAVPGQSFQQPAQPATVWQPPPPVQQAQLGVVADQGLSGAVPSTASSPAPTNGATATHKDPPLMREGGKTDEEWFGPALPDVLQLRTGVTQFLKSVSKDPPQLGPDRRPLGFGPDQAAAFMIQAAAMIENYAKQPGFPGVFAFDYLFKNEMYGDLVEILLPDVPQMFREDTLKFFYHLLSGKPIEGEIEVETEDEDDEGEEEEEESDIAPEEQERA